MSMGKTVSEVIIKLKRKNEKLKEEILLNLGIYEKAYSDQESNEYPYSEWKDNQEVYYKIVPSPLNEEEWNKILQLVHEKNVLSHLDVQPKDGGYRSSLAGLMYGLVFISFIGGFFGGFLMIDKEGFQKGIWAFIFSFVIGFIFLGLGEIISLLNNNKTNL
jgi:VIT1/CCC1 family predicted Fe2+/Mn2+ transporter